MNGQENQVTYLRWLAHEHPALYEETIRVAGEAEDTARTLGYIEEGEGLGWLNLVLQAVATVGSAVLGKKAVDKQVATQKKAIVLADAQATADRTSATQVKLLEVNTERAKANLPPVGLDGKIISASTLPLPAALRPYTTASSGAIIPGIPNLAVYAGGGLLAFVLLKRFKVV